MNDLKKLTVRRHPDYDDSKPHWDFMESCYVGGRKWFETNIFEYHKEGEEEFKKRKSRAYRFNHTREVVDLVNKYLFRVAPVRKIEDAPASIKTFWGDVNGEGMNIDDFMQVVSQKNSIFGCPWIIVDSRQREIEPNTSKSEEVEGGIYCYIVKPQNVLDLSWNSDDGLLNWILIQEFVRDDSDPFSSSGQVRPQYRLWTRSGWSLIASNATSSALEEKDSGAHALGVVPAIRADNLISAEPWTTPALINDVAYLDRAVANYLSNLDAIIQDQTFSQLAIPAQSILPGDDAHKKIVEFGTKRIFTYDSEGGAPFYLSPDPAQAHLIVSVIQQIINEIYHSVGLAGERTKQDNAKGIDNSSGVAKSKDFERVNSLLASKAMSLQAIENKICYLVSLYAGEEDKWEWDKELVTYPKTFDVRQLQDEFDIAMKLSLIGVPEILRSEQMKSLAEKLIPAASEKLKEEIMKEVAAWRERVQKQAELATALFENPQGSSIVEDAKRDRDSAGRTQSETKTRQENGNS